MNTTLGKLETGQVALVMENIVVFQLNSSEKLILYKEDKIKRGSFLSELDDLSVKLITNEELQTALNNTNHKDDWWSLMNGDLIRLHLTKS